MGLTAASAAVLPPILWIHRGKNCSKTQQTSRHGIKCVMRDKCEATTMVHNIFAMVERDSINSNEINLNTARSTFCNLKLYTHRCGECSGREMMQPHVSSIGRSCWPIDGFFFINLCDAFTPVCWP